MIAKDMMPWMFVKRTATWTPFVKVRSEAPRFEAEPFAVREPRRPVRRPPRG